MAQTAIRPARRLLAQGLLLLPLAVLAPPGQAGGHPNRALSKNEIAAKGDWYQQCQRVRALRPPARDLPGPGPAEACNATELYYDTQNMAAPTDADWKTVRECAFRTGNNGVLMMLYANGVSVVSNLDLATKFACGTESSSAEMKARLAHLRNKSPGDNFDQCDDATSGATMGFCASVRERQREKLRDDRFAVLMKGWTSKEQLGFDMAAEAAHHFAQHRYQHETDLSSPAHGALQVENIAAELDRFAVDIEDFERGKLPQFSEAEFKVLDQKMNEIYSQFMRTAPGPNSYLGTIRRSGVEQTQRSWLAYRDAMELLGSIRYPSTPAAGWRALLTSRRLTQLKELADAANGS